MSKRRLSSWSKYPKRKVGGHWLCRWCDKPLTGRRTSFCSSDCLHEILLRTDAGYVRQIIKKRDKGICALCGLNTLKLRKDLLALRKAEGYDSYLKVLKQKKIPTYRRTLWDCDHIEPVILGGGECGIENFRTLCIWCHRIETNKLRKLLAAKRAKNKSCSIK
jgi:hypothetical protein